MNDVKTCKVDGCEGDAYCKGYCNKHYQRWHKYGDPLRVSPLPEVPLEKQCSVEDCDRQIVTRKLCSSHYHRLCTYGDPLAGGEVRGIRRTTEQMVLDGGGVCPGCGEFRGLDEYFGRGDTGFSSRCKQCVTLENDQQRKENPEKFNELVKKWRAENPDKVKDIYLKNLHGITFETYDVIFHAQGGCCALCKKLLTEYRGIDTVIDHDHSCCPGRGSCGNCIRGILHRSCNQGLGVFKDDPELCYLAGDYLNEYKIS